MCLALVALAAIVALAINGLAAPSGLESPSIVKARTSVRAESKLKPGPGAERVRVEQSVESIRSGATFRVCDESGNGLNKIVVALSGLHAREIESSEIIDHEAGPVVMLEEPLTAQQGLLSFSRPGYQSASIVTPVPPGAEYDVVLRQACRLALHVTCGGEPLPGVGIVLSQFELPLTLAAGGVTIADVGIDAGVMHATTDNSGIAVFDRLPPGEYVVSSRDQSFMLTKGFSPLGIKVVTPNSSLDVEAYHVLAALLRTGGEHIYSISVVDGGSSSVPASPELGRRRLILGRGRTDAYPVVMGSDKPEALVKLLVDGSEFGCRVLEGVVLRGLADAPVIDLPAPVQTGVDKRGAILVRVLSNDMLLEVPLRLVAKSGNGNVALVSGSRRAVEPGTYSLGVMEPSLAKLIRTANGYQSEYVVQAGGVTEVVLALPISWHYGNYRFIWGSGNTPREVTVLWQHPASGMNGLFCTSFPESCWISVPAGELELTMVCHGCPDTIISRNFEPGRLAGQGTLLLQQ